MLRLIHSLGGCGGTLLSRCIGVLPNVALLSEVNPASVKLFLSFDPLYQDERWLHLLTKEDVERFSRLDLKKPENFRDLIQVFYYRARASHRHLVIRDYNYVEFLGVPFGTDPPRRMMLHGALPSNIPISSVALIRHPVDQWFSLRKHQRPGSGVSPRMFCNAYLTFLRELRDTPVFKYEEFIDNANDQLRAICRNLGLEFAPSFAERFHKFDCVTGDLKRLRDRSISPSPRQPVAPEIMEEFRSSESFRSILETTGYSDSRTATQ
jgi:protein O-GlcNAc transferase